METMAIIVMLVNSLGLGIILGDLAQIALDRVETGSFLR